MGRVARARLLLGLLGCVSVGHAAARPSLEEARVAPAPAATARRLEATAPDQRDARAYVALWHECSPYGSHTLLALRVLAHSLRRSGTRVPFVVYVDASVSSHSRQALREDRIGVLDIPRPQGGGPNHVAGASAEDERSLCALWWRQSLWALTDYSRVVNVEAHHHAAENPDPLFDCGPFCVPESQPAAFYSDLMVVTPGHTQSLALYRRAIGSARPATVQQGLLPVLQDVVLAAPLFVPAADSEGPALEPLTHPAAVAAGLRRLPVQASMNHMVYYEKLSWSLFACGPLADRPVPAYLLSYGYSPRLLGLPTLPWFWWSFAFFTLHAAWDGDRRALDPADGALVWAPAALTIVAAAVAAAALALRFRALHGAPKTVTALRTISRPGLGRVIAFALSSAIVVLCAFTAGNSLPYSLPRHLAWPLFLLIDHVLLYCVARLLLSARVVRENSALGDPVLLTRGGIALIAALAWHAVNVNGDQLPHFVLKAMNTVVGLFIVASFQLKLVYTHALVHPR